MRLYKKHNTLNMSHEEWLECRRQGIGGSDAGAGNDEVDTDGDKQQG